MTGAGQGAKHINPVICKRGGGSIVADGGSGGSGDSRRRWPAGEGTEQFRVHPLLSAAAH